MTGLLTSYGGLRPDAKAYIMAGRGVVVDKNGRGDFTTVQDAVDYMAARSSAGHIWVREGTYNESVAMASTFINIEGASWETIVDATGTTLSAIMFNSGAHRCTVKNLQAKTTKGGSDGNCFNWASGSYNNHVRDCYSPESDAGSVSFAGGGWNIITGCELKNADGNIITFHSSANIVSSCQIYNADGWGCEMAAGGDDSQVIGNLFSSNSSGAILIDTNAEDCVVVGNRTFGGAITDNSETSTEAGNDETA